MARNTRTARNAFSRFTQPIICGECGKSCLANVNGEGNEGVCIDCWTLGGILNGHSDGHHIDEPCAECPECNPVTSAPKAQKEPVMTAATRKTLATLKAEVEAVEPELDIEETDAEEVDAEESEAAPTKKAKVVDPRIAAAKVKAEAAREAHAEAVAALAAAKEARKASLAALMAANREWSDLTRTVHMERAARETGKAATELVPA